MKIKWRVYVNGNYGMEYDLINDSWFANYDWIPSPKSNVGGSK